MRLARIRAQWWHISRFARQLRANSTATRRLNEQLVVENGYTVEDYEILVRVARSADMRVRRVDLVEQPLLTAANVTRQLDGLERSGLLELDSSAEDPLTAYVALTDAGRASVHEATASNLALVDELFGSLFQDDGDESLAALLARFERLRLR